MFEFVVQCFSFGFAFMGMLLALLSGMFICGLVVVGSCFLLSIIYDYVIDFFERKDGRR